MVSTVLERKIYYDVRAHNMGDMTELERSPEVFLGEGTLELRDLKQEQEFTK